MQNKKYISLIVALATVGSLAMAIPAFAQTAEQPAVGNGRFGRGMMGRGVKAGMGVVGTVASNNGTTLTVTGRVKPNGGAAITYTVTPAANATIMKNGQAVALSGILANDTVVVQGAVTGTAVSATAIRDGVPAQPQPVIQGNGQPVVAGKVTAINGTQISISNSSNVSYAIETSGAKFVVRGVTAPTISNVAVGDNLVVQGTVNGTSVTASSVIDQKPANLNPGNPKPQGGFMGGMMDGIGSFFRKMFGF